MTMTLFERLRKGISNEPATAIPAKPANAATQLAEISSFSSSSLPANQMLGGASTFKKCRECAYPAHDISATAANDTDEAPPEWLTTLLGRVDVCDALINQLCNARGDDAARRADLLATRRTTSPANLDSDNEYLRAEIAALTPAPPAPATATGRCIDCASFRRAGLGERCGHPARSRLGEPPLADCLPAHACGLFVHWCNP